MPSRLYKRGTHASQAARQAYAKRLDAYKAKIEANEDPGPELEPFQDPGKADIQAAREKLGEARRQRNTAASASAPRINAPRASLAISGLEARARGARSSSGEGIRVTSSTQ
ncbi:putative T7SS-secreted protein [Streptomyces sp. NPDC047085]|uniref:putative T7SS-secreted protein n=1 Tax=Streptomyces sp. NPDC047085 TaxID=3155140 RepID=UPI0033D52432